MDLTMDVGGTEVREELASAILRGLGRAVIATDVNGLVIDWNPAAEELYGWTKAEALGRSIIDLVVPELAVAEATDIVERATQGTGWEGDFLARRRDGTPLHIRATNRPIVDEHGTVIGVVGESEDVTAVREGEAELRASNDRWRLALQAGRLGTWQWDQRTGIVLWDERLEALYGLGPGTFPGTFDAYQQLLHPDDRETVMATVAAAMADVRPYEVAHRAVWSDGTVHWLEGRGEPILDPAGHVVGAIGCTADATERHRTASRLTGLQAVSAGLATATTAAEVIEVIVREGSTQLGGRTGSLCLLRDRGDNFELVREVGLGDHIADAWRVFPASASVPAADAVRDRAIVVLTSIAERDRRYPQFVGVPTADQAFVTVPLLLEHRPLGAFTIGFGLPRTFDDPELDFLGTLGDLCAQAIDRAELFEANRLARLDAERATARLGLLARATGTLAATLVQQEAVDAFGPVVVPALADGCVIALLDDRGQLVPRGRFGIPDDGDAERAVLPLEARGVVLGELTLLTKTGRLLDDADLLLARELAERAALALDRSRLFEDRSRVAATLQASLLPPTLPEVAGLELGAVYVAAGSGAEVGGDFYDAIALDEGRWLVTIGDVRGKGIEAAEVTALARHTIRSAAVLDPEPVAVLRHLNEMLLRSFATGDIEPRFCTIVVAILDAVGDGTYRLTTAVGGHPLPLHWSGGSVAELGQPGTVMGVVAEVELHSTTTVLGPDDVVVFFTDGVSERRDGGRFFETSGIRDAVSIEPGRGARAIAEGIEAAVRSYAVTPPVDDMAVLVVRVLPAG